MNQNWRSTHTQAPRIQNRGRFRRSNIRELTQPRRRRHQGRHKFAYLIVKNNSCATTPFRSSIYDKRDDFTFRIVNFPHMDSNIPANPAYGVYISQLVRYARICTSKVDFMNRLRGLSLRLRQQGFLTNLLQRTFTKFFNRHGLIVVKYDATLREMRFAIQA